MVEETFSLLGFCCDFFFKFVRMSAVGIVELDGFEFFDGIGI